MRIINVSLSIILLGLGFIGILLPGLPATPFILGAGYFGARGSVHLNNKIRSMKMYEETVGFYQENKGFTIRRKVSILAVAGSSMAMVAYLSHSVLIGVTLLVVFSIKCYVFIRVIGTVAHD